MLAQIDLVHIQLEDARLGQRAVDLPRQQDLVPLAGERFLAREVEIARHLHGDGGGALRVAFAQIGQRGAEQARYVHAHVVEELVVLGGQQRIGHALWHALDRDELAVLGAELANQHVVAGVDAQRHVGAIVAQGIDIGELAQAEYRGKTGEQHAARCQRRGDAGSLDCKSFHGAHSTVLQVAATPLRYPNDRWVVSSPHGPRSVRVDDAALVGQSRTGPATSRAVRRW
ncbi:hypothetical protein D3C81_1479250 [compost metagenome]